MRRCSLLPDPLGRQERGLGAARWVNLGLLRCCLGLRVLFVGETEAQGRRELVLCSKGTLVLQPLALG